MKHGAVTAAPLDRASYWLGVRSHLHLDGDRVNITDHVVDRHVRDGHGADVAVRFIGKSGIDVVSTLTFAELAVQSRRFAGVLRELGVEHGDTVALLSGRTPATYVAALGTWRAGGVVCPLFAAFGPEPLRQRLELGHARVLVTTASGYRRKIEALRPGLGELRHVLVTDVGPDEAPPGTESLAALMDVATIVPDAPTRRDDPATIHFTSGTTGTPKGAVHVHDAVVALSATASEVFELERDDVYWCTADPGWVTGTSYGIIAPLAAGVTTVVDEAELDPARWYSILERERVSVWYTAPTAIRMLMRAGSELAHQHDLCCLRLVASVGEPLSREAVEWGAGAFGTPIRDTWWQTETGAIMIANRARSGVRAGSMGTAVPGIDAALLACDDEGTLVRSGGHVVEVHDPDAIGMIAIRPGWPSMFRAYIDAPERYERTFTDGWYLTGDLARRDHDGWFWFVGRADDVIKTAGHLIGPFEVESVLNEHPDVVASGVYGVPDPVAGQAIHAAVVLAPGVPVDETTTSGIMAHARRHLGAAVAPRVITPVDALPYTRSGKVMRRVLRARELGLPEGDTSTLESGGAP